MKTAIVFAFLVVFAIACVQAEEEGLHSELLEESHPRFARDTCSYQECDALCRRLGRSGGACVGKNAIATILKYEEYFKCKQ